MSFPKEIFGFSMKIQFFLRKYNAFHEKHSFFFGNIWISKEYQNFLRKYNAPIENLIRKWKEKRRRLPERILVSSYWEFNLKVIGKEEDEEEEASRENSGEFRLRFLCENNRKRGGGLQGEFWWVSIENIIKK